MRKVAKLTREFCVIYSGVLRVLACMSPVVVWKFMYPEVYYSSGWSVYADFCIFVLLPVLPVLMIWEFIKHKRQSVNTRLVDD